MGAKEFRPTAPGIAAEVLSPTVKVTRTYKGRDPVETEEALDIHAFVTSTATASARVNRTINLGNYESLRLEVGVSLPCYTEEITDALDAAIELATARLQQEIDTIPASK